MRCGVIICLFLSACGLSDTTCLADALETKSARSHWAFQPLKMPKTEAGEGGSHPIDTFVHAKLAASGLEPSPRANPRVLARRAYLGLLGVPPTFVESSRFVVDESPHAFEDLVDELLSRSEYGERWGRHWLDVARYSDAKGYVDAGEPKYPFAYTYRDYVIDAFNRDLPFDQFVREQIAADHFLTDENDPSSLAALGFLTVGARFNFFPHEIIDDRIDSVTRGFLGLTVSCSRCHDHKFDPIPARDYYALYSVFANSYEPTLDQVPRLTTSGAGEDKEFAAKIEKVAAKHIEVRTALHQKMMHEMRAWSGDYLRYIVQTTPEHRTLPQADLRTKRGLVRVFSAYAKGGVVRWRRFLDSRRADDPVWGLWQRLAASTKEQIPELFPGALSEWEASQPNRLVLAAFREAQVGDLADAADLYGGLLEKTAEKWAAMLEKSPSAEGFDDVAEEQLRQALYGPEAPGTIRLDDSDDLYTLDESVESRKAFANVERVFLEKWREVSPRPMVLRDRPAVLPQHVFVRGDAQRLGELVARIIPATITGTRSSEILQGSGRRELAEVIASSENPLTARVIVNRVWAWHFGRGLVATPSDFGVRSAPPSHPELLDYLATWLIRNDWSLKKLNRLIMTSQTWQQASGDRPDCRTLDPENTLLWKASRKRLDFEAMRDSMLAVSGLLQPFPGGPPLEKSPDDVSNFHRTVYAYVDREKLADVYRVFDFPSPEISSPQRSETTVPQQALFLLNNPFVKTQAAAVAERVPSGSSQIMARNLYRKVLSREPNDAELEMAVEFLSSEGIGVRELAQSLLVSNEFLFAD